MQTYWCQKALEPSIVIWGKKRRQPSKRPGEPQDLMRGTRNWKKFLWNSTRRLHQMMSLLLLVTVLHRWWMMKSRYSKNNVPRNGKSWSRFGSIQIHRRRRAALKGGLPGQQMRWDHCRRPSTKKGGPQGPDFSVPLFEWTSGKVRGVVRRNVWSKNQHLPIIKEIYGVSVIYLKLKFSAVNVQFSLSAIAEIIP